MRVCQYHVRAGPFIMGQNEGRQPIVKVTITDVARAAGVSMKTVSRVLNDEPNVTDATRKRVKQAAKELRYRPNLSARGLAGSKSYLLALLYDNPSADYIARITQGATDACREKGYHLMVEPLDLAEGDLTTDIELLLERLPVDGVILTPPLCDSRRILSVLTKAGTPFVRVSPSFDPAMSPSVVMDDESAAYEMTRHLIKDGHKDIGFIIGHKDHSAAMLRRQGFERAMSDASLLINPRWIKQGDFSYDSGCKAAKAILSEEKRPSAIFASNDDMAAAVMSVAGNKSLSVPGDLSVCGFDDTALARMLWPALTTVKQPILDMGALAVNMLIGSAQDKAQSGAPLTLEHEIITRDSTGRASR